MIKNSLLLFALIFSLSCSESTELKEDLSDSVEFSEDILEEVLHYRNEAIKTDYLSRQFPDLDRDKAIELQMLTLKKELANGEELMGWKMGGTTGDSSTFDPMMGYLLSKRQYFPGDEVSITKFPGAEVMVEAEVGFVFNRDFPNGVSSMEELKEGIDYAVPAIEFAQSNAIGIDDDATTVSTNHVLAFGMGQAGFVLGNKQIPMADFDILNETAECFIDGVLAVKGGSSRIYRGHLNALYALVNLLPKHGVQVSKGEVAITGSMYPNPTVKSAAAIKLAFKSLEEVHIQITE